MPQGNALLDMNIEFGVTAEERERYNDFLFIRYAKEKLEESKAFAAANPNAWTDGDDFIAEIEQLDREAGIYED
jgi:hypothetical protein